MNAEQLSEALATRRTARLLGNWKPYARTRPIASDLGDCDRAIVLGVLAWGSRPIPSPTAMERMEQGNEAEQVILKQLRAEGWKIVQEQLPFEQRGRDGRRVIASGKMEGLIVVDDPAGGRPKLVPFEIKDTSFANFLRWSTEEDLRTDRWARKWWRQFQMYLIGQGYEWGLLILAHRGERKAIPIHLDYAAAETLLSRLERAADVIAALQGDKVETLDASISALGMPHLDEPSTCKTCDFFLRACFPKVEHATAGDLIVLDEENASRISQMMALKPDKLAYDRADRWIKKLVPEGAHAICGDWIITGRWKEENTSAVPAQAAKPAGKRNVWKREIVRVDAPAKSEAEAEAEDAA